MATFSNLVQVRRDPFGRTTLMRVRCEAKVKCAFCGQAAKYRYGWHDDSVGRGFSAPAKAFCGIGCWEDYNG